MGLVSQVTARARLARAKRPTKLSTGKEALHENAFESYPQVGGERVADLSEML
jgi:hypothetical protein